jgi:hypothetical protein
MTYPKFCWICSRKFWGNKVYLIDVRDEGVRHVHKSCALCSGYEPRRIKMERDHEM